MVTDPLILIPCAKTSKNYRCKAREMYSPSIYFQKIWKYAHLLGESIMILSSKYGLLHPETEIDPYDEFLSSTSRAKSWARKVAPELITLIQFGQYQRVVFLTGAKYSRYLKELLIDLVEDAGLIIDDPLEGLGIGQRLQLLTQNINNKTISIECEICGEKEQIYYEDYQELMSSDCAVECYACAGQDEPECEDDYDSDDDEPEWDDEGVYL